ncbi:LytR/AlgR family response regulator transcription factor [Dyadobacter frigoris]|uniref:Response regulator transcription factor n=1 Tax=Dyadobacter frigoris TaxID=2576211 RepID=A0A4U6DA89_9BACT|nr:response regulator transcription factor [Dyadobacter frigoris]TKT93098.1 response regulator transcription factor [Dyadobacter frigoris]GLU55973.1 DNA-binding response regulator [Dyadobacter frigoris]
MNKNIQCFIIDDEPHARDVIKKFVSRVPFLEITGEFDNALEALFQIHDKKPDLVFLDVEMPEMNGFEFIRTLQGHRPQIIMVTAYQRYALDGFDHQVADYLLKPIAFERFIRAVYKVTELLPGLEPASQTYPSNYLIPEKPVKILYQPIKKQNNNDDFLLIKEDKKLIRLVIDEIVLIEAMKDYVKIHLPSRTIITHVTMSKIQEILPADRFLRVSRSSILRKNVIGEIEGNQIITTDGKKVHIGITYREIVMKILKNKV